MTDPSALSSRDRETLLKLHRARKKMARCAVIERSARLKAEFEQQVATVYEPRDHAAWKKAAEMAKAAVDEAQRQVTAECTRLGISPRFAPRLDVHWYGRGENAVVQRRQELRKVADAMIFRLEKSAIAALERIALSTETEILAGALSAAGRQFLESLPEVEALMPQLELPQMEALLPGSRYGDDY